MGEQSGEYTVIELNRTGGTSGFESYDAAKIWVEESCGRALDAPAMGIVNESGNLEAIYAEGQWFS